MMNGIWAFMVMAAVLCGAFTGKLSEVSKASVDNAETAVKLALGLVGMMSLWIGLMKVLEEAGLLAVLARLIKPVMRRLFPGVPEEHPAMSMMILNTSANILGLSNAATPFGIKAMAELDALNPHRGEASDAMALFLAINTAGVCVFPTTMIALRASLNASSAGSIILPTLVASIVGTAVAVLAALMLQRLELFRFKTSAVAPARFESGPSASAAPVEPATVDRPWVVAVAAAMICALGFALHEKVAAVGWGGAVRTMFSDWSLVLLIGVITLVGLKRGVKIYDVVVEGGKEGFDIALKIIPFLIAMLVGVGMLRASGAVDLMVRALSPVTALIGMPAEVLPMALLRSLTGGGSLGVATEIMKTHGPDSLAGVMASSIYGSSETTFYVIAVYFGSVQVKNGRHTLLVCLLADAAAVLASVWLCRWIVA
ncbi:MAG: nucleoside recognition domain-containing protein [Elusimicrobiota bacterium]